MTRTKRQENGLKYAREIFKRICEHEKFESNDLFFDLTKNGRYTRKQTKDFYMSLSEKLYNLLRFIIEIEQRNKRKKHFDLFDILQKFAEINS
jgi:hypothetical protein